MKVTLDHVTNRSENINTFYFKSDKPSRHIAGQFVELTIPHDSPDKRGQKRWFTLTSSPTEELLSITTKYAAKDGSTFKQALSRLQPGAELQMSDSMGDFVLPKDKTTELIFVAGGIGVTPFRSMIKWLTDSGESRSVSLLYAANSPAEVLFQDDISAYNTRFVATVNIAPDEWQGEVGYLTAERIIDFAGSDLSNKLVFLSGPEPMIEALVAGLNKNGVDKKRLVTDYFPGYTEI